MTVAITDDHLELARTADSFLRSVEARSEARKLLDAATDSVPAFWSSLAEVGWLGLHVAEQYGGSGYGLLELAVVTESLGRAAAPGPFLPTVVTSAVIGACGTDAQRTTLLPGLADGTTVAGLGLHGRVEAAGDTVSGDAGIVWCAAVADLLTIVADDDVYLVPRDASGVRISSDPSFDPTRRSARVRLDGVPIGDITVIPGARTIAVSVARTLIAAEAAGGAHECCDMAVEYAKSRRQFGRTIGTFGPVKHHCADMFTEAELASAAVWDAARTGPDDAAQFSVAAAAATAVAVPAFRQNAQRNIQIHGGIGFTWEHDAHIFLRRAAATTAMTHPVTAAEDLVDHADGGTSRNATLELPVGAEDVRTEIRGAVDRVAAAQRTEQRVALVDSGLAMPHWPAPWGRDATPLEQLVIDEELARVDVHKVRLGITGWILATLIQHGTEDQIERWIRPALLGEVVWCQLFSEPDAGSDAAAIRTRARRTDGGWLVNGQKVWTSQARESALGLATVRTDPDVPKHAGITTMVIDMSSPGVTVKPLRDAAGSALFNEVFLDDVFVPDDNVVGTVDGGWSVARSTLGNERISIGGDGLVAGIDPLRAWRARRVDFDGGKARTGDLIARQQALHAINLRKAARAVAGSEPGPEGNVVKLLNAEHGQRSLDVAIELLGPDTALLAGDAAEIDLLYVYARQNTIAGGTSEISRNQIGERILGLPRDPLLA